MKCQHCGGSMIYDPRNYPDEPSLKCMSCGREPKEGGGKMAEEKQTCIKCGNEYPATIEFFNACSAKKNGLDSRCKTCMKKYNSDRRAVQGKMKPSNGRKKKSTVALHERISPATLRTPQPTPITRATPEEIIAALRKGVAEEIIQTVRERFGL